MYSVSSGPERSMLQRFYLITNNGVLQRLLPRLLPLPITTLVTRAKQNDGSPTLFLWFLSLLTAPFFFSFLILLPSPLSLLAGLPPSRSASDS